MGSRVRRAKEKGAGAAAGGAGEPKKWRQGKTSLWPSGGLCEAFPVRGTEKTAWPPGLTPYTAQFFFIGKKLCESFK